MAMLRAVGLGKDYGDAVAVGALDLEVEDGEILGLLGPNGAGKTTTISMVCGVLTPSRGTAVIAGHDIGAEPFAARRALGLVPQELALYEELSARQNLAFFGRLHGLRGALLAGRIAWALDIAGLSERADDVVARFSGGMKRRLNLAAGLLHRPRLLVLDEPTVGVDPQSRNHIFETVRALQRDQGMTVLYTSHYMEEVQALCDRVAIMDHGRLVALDTMDGILAAHAGDLVAIEVTGDVDAAREAAARALPGVDVHVHGSSLRLGAPGALGPVIAAIEEAGARVRSVQTLQADLESVFLTVTGTSLRDH